MHSSVVRSSYFSFPQSIKQPLNAADYDLMKPVRHSEQVLSLESHTRHLLVPHGQSPLVAAYPFEQVVHSFELYSEQVLQSGWQTGCSSSSSSPFTTDEF